MWLTCVSIAGYFIYQHQKTSGKEVKQWLEDIEELASNLAFGGAVYYIELKSPRNRPYFLACIKTDSIIIDRDFISNKNPYLHYDFDSDILPLIIQSSGRSKSEIESIESARYVVFDRKPSRNLKIYDKNGNVIYSVDWLDIPDLRDSENAHTRDCIKHFEDGE